MRRSLSPVVILRRLCACAAVLAVFAWSTPIATGADVGTERGIKAAFVAKFIGYVDFPATAEPVAGPLVIGVVGADDIAAELARIVATRGGAVRPVTVKRMDADDPLEDVDVLFVGLSEAERAERLLRAAATQGILTITEFDGALRQGSVINFRIVNERVRFEVSLGAAERANLKLSSRLLSVAYHVQRETP
ncbi:YfiR family protein [Massilia cavernae]|nr:YfiR family protein [Massilia cavernae]